MKYLGIGSRLKELRISNNLTQQQVSERIGVAVSTYSGYELDNKQPSYAILIKLASLYKVSSDYLIGIEQRTCIDITGLNAKEVQVISDMIDLLKNKSKD